MGKPNSQYTPKHKKHVVESKTNDGGFYEGMPGCTIEDGNRRMIQIVVTPEGEEKAQIFAHPKICALALREAMQNKMVQGIIYGAAIDHMFDNKSLSNILIRMIYKSRLRKYNRKAKKAIKKEQTENANSERTEQIHKEAGRPSETLRSV